MERKAPVKLVGYYMWQSARRRKSDTITVKYTCVNKTAAASSSSGGFW